MYVARYDSSAYRLSVHEFPFDAMVKPWKFPSPLPLQRKGLFRYQSRGGCSASSSSHVAEETMFQCSKSLRRYRRPKEPADIIGAPSGRSKRKHASAEQFLSESSPTGRRSKRHRRSSSSAREFTSPGTASNDVAPPSPLSTHMRGSGFGSP